MAQPVEPKTPETGRTAVLSRFAGRQREASQSPAAEAEEPTRESRESEPVLRRLEPSEVRDGSLQDERWQQSALPALKPTPQDKSGSRKVPFWKRLTLPRSPSVSPPPQFEASPTPNLEPVLARLAALEKQLAANQVATENQLTRFEENIIRLWELEDDLALTEVRERLALLEANQEEIADGLHAVGRNLMILTLAIGGAVLAGLALLALLL